MASLTLEGFLFSAIRLSTLASKAFKLSLTPEVLLFRAIRLCTCDSRDFIALEVLLFSSTTLSIFLFSHFAAALLPEGVLLFSVIRFSTFASKDPMESLLPEALFVISIRPSIFASKALIARESWFIVHWQLQLFTGVLSHRGVWPLFATGKLVAPLIDEALIRPSRTNGKCIVSNR